MAERLTHLSKAFAAHSRTASGQRDLMRSEDTRQVETVVFAVIPEFDQVKVRDHEGHIYALTRKTSGVDLLALHEGQRIVCTVTRKLPRVLCAEAVA